MLDLTYGEETLGGINPQNIRMYLSSRGWTCEHRESTFDVYSDGSGNTVIVPADRQLRDYAYRVEELIRDLSKIYKESPQFIFSGMTLSASTDVMEYRYESPDSETGMIPLPALSRIITSISSINIAAYRDAVDYKPVYKTMKWEGKKDLDSIRVGPTLPGSYIIQVVYPATSNTRLGQSTIEGGVRLDDPRMRMLCDKIENSINTIIDAAERGRSEIDPECRISHNFVSSIMDLQFDNADVEIQRKKTIGEPNVRSRPMALTRKVFKNISVIEENMRPPTSDKVRQFVGVLTEVSDFRKEPGDEPINMKIRYFNDDNQLSTARFTISGEDVDVAYDAIQNRKTVSISGILTGTPNSKKIEDIVDFKIVS